MSRMRDEVDAQATVEMAIVLPVMIALAIIVYNAMVFTSAAARFDRIAPDIVLAQGVSPSGGGQGGVVSSRDAVEKGLVEGMQGYEVEIDVQVLGGAGGAARESGAMLGLVGEMRSYRCVMRYEPWPRMGLFVGVNVGVPEALTHERVVTVDPWRPGVVM